MSQLGPFFRTKLKCAKGDRLGPLKCLPNYDVYCLAFIQMRSSLLLRKKRNENSSKIFCEAILHLLQFYGALVSIKRIIDEFLSYQMKLMQCLCSLNVFFRSGAGGQF